MADITIYVPDGLRAKLQGAGLPVSRICQRALTGALAAQERQAAATNRPSQPAGRP